MPIYSYRCRECAETFEVNRPMSESSEPAPCPGGHADTVKLLATVGLNTGAPEPRGGGCCGGGCCN